MKEKPNITQNIMPEFHLFAPRINPIEIVAKQIGRTLRLVPELFKMHQLASHGDNFNGGADEMLLQEPTEL